MSQIVTTDFLLTFYEEDKVRREVPALGESWPAPRICAMICPLLSVEPLIDAIVANRRFESGVVHSSKVLEVAHRSAHRSKSSAAPGREVFLR
jgi:hypothetical protein